MSDTKRIKELLRERVAELAQYLYPSGKREGPQWCVGDITGVPGKSFKICIAGDKTGLWGDFADSGKHSRNLLDLWMNARNVDLGVALREAADWCGQPLNGRNGTAIRPPASTLRIRSSPPGAPSGQEDANKPLFDWRKCADALPKKRIEQLAKERGYSVETCSWLKQSDLVGLHNGHIAFPVHDEAGAVTGAHYKPRRGANWFYTPGLKVRSLVVGELIPGDPIHCFESYWDAFDFMDKSGDHSGIIITRGAGNGALVSGLIPESSAVYAWSQNDKAGEKWENDVCAATKAIVKRAKIPAPHKDLNDWARSGASSDDLLAAIMNAEVIRESEKIDNQSAEAGSAVGLLELPGTDPRKSLPHVILPSGDVTISQCGAQIFSLVAPTKSMFIRGGVVTIIDRNDRGEYVLEPLRPSAARSCFEKHGRLFAWRIGYKGKEVLKPAICPEETARAIIESKEARDLLPKISGLINCPFLKTVDGKLSVSEVGYDEDTGVLVTGGEKPAAVPLTEAVAALRELVAEFDFQCPGDRSRALASFIAPALKIGGLIEGKVPADVAEADQSQSGKTYRQKLVAAVYNENVSMVSQKTGGVGSVDESLSARLVEGRPFIQFDNFRGRMDSAHLEAFLTAEGSFPARVPHRSEVQIDPDRFFIFLSSNGVETTRDMANRSSIIRLRKREGFTYSNFPEGDLLSHIRANQHYYLGCVFAVIKEWYCAGRPRSSEPRHDFRGWCQALDWIVQNLFKAAPLMEGHQGAQERVSNPGLTFVRKLCLALDAEDSLGLPLIASQLYEIAENTGIEVPGLRVVDEDKARRVIGSIMAKIFKNGDTVELDGFQVVKQESLRDREDVTAGGRYSVKTYIFTKL